VTRALGIETTVAVDIKEELALPGDIYIVCSDGLNDMLEDEEIHLTINALGANLDKAAEALIRQANQKGGKDNVSVILARPTGAATESRGWLRTVVGWLSKR
jgi:protein phosphatase